MKILVKATTNAKKIFVERVTQPTLNFEQDTEATIEYKVAVHEAPVGGRANKAIIDALAEYFDIAPSRITLLSGQTSKRKLFSIE